MIVAYGYGATGVNYDFFAYDRDGGVYNGSTFVDWSDADYVSYRIAATSVATVGGEDRYEADMPAGTIRYELRYRGATVDESYMVWVETIGIVSPAPVYGDSPQLTLCSLVADALDGQEFGGLSVTAKADDLLPKYESDDIPDTGLMIDVVPAAEPFTVNQQTHGTALEDCSIVVSVEGKCDVSGGDTSYRSMLKAIRDISIYLQSVDLTSAGFHGPFDNTFEDRPEAVDTASRFDGYVSLTYRTVTET